MSKFKVGDYVKANALTDGKYNFTCLKKAWFGQITAVRGNVFDAPGGLDLMEECFDLCDSKGVLVGDPGCDLRSLNKFKVGDLVTSIHEKKSPNGYGWTVGDFQGVVRGYSASKIIVEITKVKTGGDSTQLGQKCTVVEEEFKLVEVAAKSSSRSKEPQTFMEGVDIKIASKPLGYYDIGTEDYVGDVGNIRHYSTYSAPDGCWIMDVEMGDGELLEVLENECEAYAGLTKAKPKPAFRKVDVEPVMPFHPFATSDPGHTHDYHPIESKKSVGDPGFDLRVETHKAEGMRFEVGKFDITPKPKALPKLVF